MKKSEERDALNLAVPLYAPPPELEDKIMAAVTRKPPRRLPWVPLLSAAAAALAVGNLAQLAVPRAEPVHTAKAAAPGAEMLPPGLKVVMLNGNDQAPKAFGTIVLDPDDNHGILAVRDLPASSGHYELWLINKGQIVTAGTFEVNDDGYGALMLKIPEGATDIHEFRLTPAGVKKVVMTGRF
jgi:hypothetical protein